MLKEINKICFTQELSRPYYVRNKNNSPLPSSLPPPWLPEIQKHQVMMNWCKAELQASTTNGSTLTVGCPKINPSFFLFFFLLPVSKTDLQWDYRKQMGFRLHPSSRNATKKTSQEKFSLLPFTQLPNQKTPCQKCGSQSHTSNYHCQASLSTTSSWRVSWSHQWALNRLHAAVTEPVAELPSGRSPWRRPCFARDHNRLNLHLLSQV